MATRDIKGDYRRAYLAEHKALRAQGRHEDADAIAKLLKDHYGHDVTERGAAEKERKDQPPPPENTAEPKPKTRGRPQKSDQGE